MYRAPLTSVVSTIFRKSVVSMLGGVKAVVASRSSRVFHPVPRLCYLILFVVVLGMLTAAM
jgi:hypothetical protein